jgi:hypothetical protein
VARKKDKAPAGEPAETPSVVAHPRARVSIRRWRGRAGMLGLVLVTVLSLRAGVPAFVWDDRGWFRLALWMR